MESSRPGVVGGFDRDLHAFNAHAFKRDRVRCLMVDNYDSFTYNLVQYFQTMGITVHTVRNDALSVEEALAKDVHFYVLSPGPSTPDQAGISVPLVQACARARRPLFGVCLGMQAIAQAFGASIERAPTPMHGKVSDIEHSGLGVFEDLPQPLQATRYHSLVVQPESLKNAPDLEVTARSVDGVVQGLRHTKLLMEGVQFHPESVLTKSGIYLLAKFARLALKTRSFAATS